MANSTLEISFYTLQKEFISVHKDEKGMYVRGAFYDYRYVRDEAKIMGIILEVTDKSLQNDDSTKYYFTIK